MSDLQRKLMAKFPSPTSCITYNSANNSNRREHRSRGFQPFSWQEYFDKSEYVVIDTFGKFHVYRSGNDGPLLVFLHGAGFSALTWAVLTKIIRSQVNVQILAIDLRGHGNSYTNNDCDMSMSTLILDVFNIVDSLFKTRPKTLLIGHSMGGALATRIAHCWNVCEAGHNRGELCGLVVIDVVEGSALTALSSMHSVIRSRPRSFTSLSQAIEWGYCSGLTRNLESAQVSMAGHLVCEKSQFAEESNLSPESTDIPSTSTKEMESIPNEVDLVSFNAESDNSSINLTDATSSHYTWRVDLLQTEPYWRDWFEGLSEMFLQTSTSKLLLLAGMDRLDRQLTIGQMQGKFQLHVLPKSGHTVHEDFPEKVADILVGFLKRHKIVSRDSSDLQ